MGSPEIAEESASDSPPTRKREFAVGHGLSSGKGSANSLFLVGQLHKLFLDGPLEPVPRDRLLVVSGEQGRTVEDPQAGSRAEIMPIAFRDAGPREVTVSDAAANRFDFPLTSLPRSK